MISRKHRFHGYGSLSKVYRSGQVSRGPNFALRVVRGTNKTGYRAAVVVSKKVAKSAVVRNRIRRRLFEALRSFEPELDQSADIIITVFSTEFDELSHQVLLEIGRASCRERV